ncbi:MAG: hypothetical protein AAGI25_11345, partial [Bacteroidota bacterium]
GFENGELHLMKKCVAGGSSLIATLGTLTSPPQLSLAIVGVLTFFTNEAIGPFELSEVVIASLVIRKLLLELKEGEALVFFSIILIVKYYFKLLKNNSLTKQYRHQK